MFKPNVSKLLDSGLKDLSPAPYEYQSPKNAKIVNQDSNSKTATFGIIKEKVDGSVTIASEN